MTMSKVVVDCFLMPFKSVVSEAINRNVHMYRKSSFLKYIMFEFPIPGNRSLSVS